LPEERAFLDIDRIDVVRHTCNDGDFLRPLLVFSRLTTSVGSIECISRGWLSVLIFHKSFMFLTFSVVRIFSSFCHAVRCGLPPSVNQSAPHVTADASITPR